SHIRQQGCRTIMDPYSNFNTFPIVIHINTGLSGYNGGKDLVQLFLVNPVVIILFAIVPKTGMTAYTCVFTQRDSCKDITEILRKMKRVFYFFQNLRLGVL